MLNEPDNEILSREEADIVVERVRRLFGDHIADRVTVIDRTTMEDESKS